MRSTTIRVSLETRDKLKEITERTGESMQSVVDRAIEELRRRDFWDRTNSAFAALRKDDDAWRAEQKERSEWDQTLADGLED